MIGNIYITTNVLIPKQAYQVYFSYNTTDDLEYTDFGETWYYTYFSNSPVTSGDGISSSLNDDTDIGFINVISDLTDFTEEDQQNLDYELNSQYFDFAGTFASGDIFNGNLADKLGYEDYTHNGYSVLVWRIYKQFLNAMHSELGSSQPLTFSIHGKNFTIYAESFALPDNGIRSFVRLVLIGGLFILWIQQIHYFIIAISTADLYGVIRNFNQKHTFFM